MVNMGSILESYDMGTHSASKSSGPSLERRTGRYTTIIPERCKFYAEFFSHLNRRECESIFWASIIMIVILLSVVVYMSNKAHRISQLVPDPEMGLDQEKLDRKNLRMRKRLFGVSLGCFLLAIGTTVLSSFAGLSIAWCFGEDLINFYWSIWTLIDIGSVIAMLGTVLQQFYSLNSHELKQPPWNIALGTPIPVMAAIMHLSSSKAKKKWEKVTKRKKSTASEDMRSVTMRSSSSRISLSNAKFLSVNPDGTCVIEIEMSPELLQRLPTPSPRQTSPATDEDAIEPAAPRDYQDITTSNSATRASSRQPQFVPPATESNAMRGVTLNDRDMQELQALRRENSRRETAREFRGRDEEEMWYMDRGRRRDYMERGRARLPSNPENGARLRLSPDYFSRPLHRRSVSPPCGLDAVARNVLYNIPSRPQHCPLHSQSQSERHRAESLPSAAIATRSRSAPPRRDNDDGFEPGSGSGPTISWAM